MVKDIDTIPLYRMARQVEVRLAENDLRQIENKFGTNSPEVAALLLDIVQRLGRQPENESFLDAIKSRINSMQSITHPSQDGPCL